jgi:hypothetical protein
VVSISTLVVFTLLLIVVLKLYDDQIANIVFKIFMTASIPIVTPDLTLHLRRLFILESAAILPQVGQFYFVVSGSVLHCR